MASTATLLFLACACALLVQTRCDGEGVQRFEMYTSDEFNNFTNEDTYADFMNVHYYRMQVYAGYWDSRSSWYPNGWSYQDSYAIYTYTNIPQQHPDWVLQDDKGNMLFIPWGCSGGKCPQYAADVGNQDFRDWWIAEAVANLGGGTYKGLWIDDVNFAWRVSDAYMNIVDPIDPRTGTNMTLSNWQLYFAEFLEQVRQKFPDIEIVHNAIWSTDPYLTSPYVKRQIQACNYYCFERGVVDGGLQPFNSGFWGLDTLLDFADKIHDLGTNIDWHSYASNKDESQYQLAWYYLMSNGKDTFGTSWSNWPTNWWYGYDINMGNAINATRYMWRDVVRRDFEAGIVLAAPPGVNATITFDQKYIDTENKTISGTVMLYERTGLVLRNPASVSITVSL